MPEWMAGWFLASSLAIIAVLVYAVILLRRIYDTLKTMGQIRPMEQRRYESQLGERPITSAPRTTFQAGDLPPEIVAPSISKPPRPPGGFGRVAKGDNDK